MGLVITIIILGIAIGLVAFFLIRSVRAPKRVEAIQKLLEQNKNQAAIKAARQLISRDGRNVEAHYLLGLAYEANGNKELALMEFKAVNDIGTYTGILREVPFRKKIAALYLEFNQTEEALKEYILLAKREPDIGGHYFQIGSLLDMRNRSQKAAMYYKKAIDLDPRNAEARARLGLILYRARRLNEARHLLDAAVRLDPENSEAWYYIGRIFKESGDCTVALSAFEKATRDDQYKVKALIERGGCLISMGNLQQAVTDLERAASIARNNSTEAIYARYFLAHAFEKTRRIERAIDEWEYIYRRRPDFKDVSEKISRYQDLRADDHVKDYLTVSQHEFAQLCGTLTEVMGLRVGDVSQISSGCDVFALEQPSKWLNTRTHTKLIRFLRTTEPIDDEAVRSTLEVMRTQNAMRAIIVATSSFDRKAREFARSRPIDLLGKDKLQALLHEAEAHTR